MRKIAIILLSAFIMNNGCDKNNSIAEKDKVSASDMERIGSMGFSKEGILKLPDGFIVEGDLFISNDHLLQAENSVIQSLNSNEEHYRHVNLVTGLPRVISIRVNASLPASYITATNAAIARYNALGLSLTFTRVTTGGSIVINGVTGTSYLSMSGFPAGGNPYGSIDLNRSYLDTWASNTVISIITHAIGHCIGFYHTDHYSSLSCNNDYTSAIISSPIHIPGTPLTGASWMNGCTTNGVNRPFTVDDVLALTTLY